MMRLLGSLTVLLTWLSPSVAAQENALAGSQIFGAKGCIRCHAVTGLGGTVGPDLGRNQQPRSFFEFGSAMWNHLPRMLEEMRKLGIDRPRLTARQAGDLVAFLFTLNYFDPPGDAAVGERVFSEKHCIRCHQVGSQGGVIGPTLDHLGDLATPIRIAAAMWNHGPQMAAVMRALNIERPVFTGAELNDLLAFLASASQELPSGQIHVLPGRVNEGHRLFVKLGCGGCHSVLGEGGIVGPDLAGQRRYRSLVDFAAAMWNKAPRMAVAMRRLDIQVPTLSAGELADIVAYLFSVQYFVESGNPNRGGAGLLERKGCLQCHALSGRGGHTAGDLAEAAPRLESPAAVVAALWNHAFLDPATVSALTESWPTLQSQEVADLMAFFRALSRPR